MAFAARALWDFSAGNGDELSFINGDILQVTNSTDPDWWEAVDANGNRGLVPANRVSAWLASGTLVRLLWSLCRFGSR